jgi:hypothetical protein
MARLPRRRVVNEPVEVLEGSSNKYEGASSGHLRRTGVVVSQCTTAATGARIGADDQPPITRVVIGHSPSPGRQVPFGEVDLLYVRHRRASERNLLFLVTADSRLDSVRDVGYDEPRWLTEIDRFHAMCKHFGSEETFVGASWPTA